MANSIFNKSLKLLCCLATFNILQAQDEDQSGGGESAAEASVTGAASQPSSTSSGSVESNPVVSMVRSGIPIEAASKIKISNIKKLASAGVSAFKVIAKQAAAGDITVEELDSSVEKLDVSTISKIASGKSNNLKQAIKDVASGKKTPDELKELAESGNFDNAYDQGDIDLTIYNTLNKKTSNLELLNAAVKATTSEASSLTAMSLAVSWVDNLLTDRVIVNSLSSEFDVDLDSLTTDRYTYELVRLLSNYGALGPNGNAFIDSYFGEGTSTFTNTSSIKALPSTTSSTADFLPYLGALSGGRVFVNEIDSETTGNDTVTKVPLKNVTLNASNNLDFTGGTIYLGDKLQKVVDSRGDDASPADENIYIVGAAKDVKFSGNVVFENRPENGANNIAEDHAFVIGAGDDVMVDGKNIEFKGANLAIGSGDQMWLASTKITTGGNLAVGALKEINISNAHFEVGNANAATSDPDNVYIYANELIQINGLKFDGSRLDDVYMEAVTLNLKNIVFPATAEVTLRSRDGSLFFNTFDDPKKGAVNLTQVKHAAISATDYLNENHFDRSKGNGHIDSKTGHLHANGTTTPWIRVRDQGAVAAGVN